MMIGKVPWKAFVRQQSWHLYPELCHMHLADECAFGSRISGNNFGIRLKRRAIVLLGPEDIGEADGNKMIGRVVWEALKKKRVGQPRFIELPLFPLVLSQS